MMKQISICSFLILSVLFSLSFFANRLQSQPFYAAAQGVSCSACHLNPAGGGARKTPESSPTFLNDSLSLGADFRATYSNDGDPLTDYTFKAQEQRVYIVAEPAEGIQFSYANESGSTAEVYGIVRSKELWDAYLRVGKFFLPYGLQISDPDNSAYIKTSPFAPKGVGFTMQPGLTDLGLEIGLAPKKSYFLNFSVTNGANKSGSGSAKAVTARIGKIFPVAALGFTGFQNGLPSVSGNETVRYGGFGWFRAGKMVLMGEVGNGYDIESSTQSRKHTTAVYAEVNYKLIGEMDSFSNDLILKGKLDYVRSDKISSEKFRYTLGLEWFLKNHISFEGQYRFLKEKPEVDNDQALLLAHLWF
ncbi:MAG: hypothetical protein HYY07_01595 [Elusimicrobia bacterium]|nr:hypothetical protein [Elusimicrobiota bacterium]